MREGIRARAIASAALIAIALLACAEKRRAEPRAPAPLAGEREAEGEPGLLARRISVSYRKARLPEVLDDLRERAGVRSAYVAFANRRFSFTHEADEIAIRELLEKLAGTGGLGFDCRGNLALIWRESDESVRRVILETPVTFEFIETPLEEALQFLQAASGIEMALDPRAVRGKGLPINLKDTGMRLHIALLWIMRLSDLEYTVCEGRVQVTESELLDSLPASETAAAPRAVALRERSPVLEEATLESLERDLADGNLGTQAALELGRMGGEEVLAILEKALQDPKPLVREMAVTALQAQCNAKALALLLRALEMEVQEEDWVRQEALRIVRESTVSFDFVDTPLRDAFPRLQSMMKGNIIVDPRAGGRVAETSVTLKVGNVTPEEALRRLLEDTGLVYAPLSRAIWITTPEGLTARGDEYNGVRWQAFWALRRFRGNAVRDELIARAAAEPCEGLREKIVEFLKTSFASDAAVEKALNGLKKSWGD